MVISEDLFSKFNLNELLLDIDVNDNIGLLDSANWLDDAFYAAADADVNLASDIFDTQSNTQVDDGLLDDVTSFSSPVQTAAGLPSLESIQSSVNWSPETASLSTLSVQSPSDEVVSLAPADITAENTNTTEGLIDGTSTMRASTSATQPLTQSALGRVGGPVRHRGRRRANRITVAAVRQAMQLSEHQQAQQQNPLESLGEFTNPSTLASTSSSPSAPNAPMQLKTLPTAESLDFGAFEYAGTDFSLSTSDMDLCLDPSASTDECSSNASQKLGSMASTMTGLTNFTGLEDTSSKGRLSLEGTDTVGSGGKRLKQGELQAAQIMGTQLSKNDLEKLEAKLEKNRKMAKESRQKKKEYVKGIEHRCRQYELVIQKLNERLAATSRCNGALIAELVASNNGVLPPNVAAILQLNLPAYTPVGFGGPGVPLMPSGGTPISMSNLAGNVEVMRQFSMQAHRPTAQHINQMRGSMPAMDPTLRPGLRCLPPHVMAPHVPGFVPAQAQPIAKQTSAPGETKGVSGTGTPIGKSQQISLCPANASSEAVSVVDFDKKLVAESESACVSLTNSVGEPLVA
ncbi:hypothetical protein SARC_11147 [Sphaeroforma arctica JP610]|uniref:BZIP domain-containing protein n=1 Tax=Sphaeroforma arctica JP610 TaxID=667725 RepID=A0A0L0FIN8_9EUKA|nr:hypothetical protein SARC_11147 [Sphaeroforma arctica JP610]KNC76346.1 hypothetical protein SARC_11147 [Sphaeroforma arctica JP610]|eukprot:XP_014150248.1 hypothetical protein SARC_11147 [Sphaeroforma arctica JP610]